MRVPDLLQTQFLKRHITMDAKAVPVAGPFAGVSIAREWFEIVDPDVPTLKVTNIGIRAFWSGVRKYGVKAVMGKPTSSGPKNTPHTGGTPIAAAA